MKEKEISDKRLIEYVDSCINYLQKDFQKYCRSYSMEVDVQCRLFHMLAGKKLLLKKKETKLESDNGDEVILDCRLHAEWSGNQYESGYNKRVDIVILDKKRDKPLVAVELKWAGEKYLNNKKWLKKSVYPDLRKLKKFKPKIKYFLLISQTEEWKGNDEKVIEDLKRKTKESKITLVLIKPKKN